ncbi:MAG: hypothetical protein ACD_60C00068G0017 [uncultured bacterium]|nr:MAG: hypothetical protein ACD_60C00068G0017 [uncultured bacterium]
MKKIIFYLKNIIYGIKDDPSILVPIFIVIFIILVLMGYFHGIDNSDCTGLPTKYC